MKRIHPLALTLAVFMGGCAPFGDALITGLASTAGLASEWAVKSFPERRAAFQTAEKAISLYLNEETLTMDKLIGILETAGLDETGWAGPTGDLYIKAGLIVWQLAGSVNHVIANNKYVVLFGREIQDGFRRGLDAPVPAAAPGKTAPLTPASVRYQPREHLGKRIVH